MGSIFSESRPAQGRTPRIFDDLLMLCQTEKLETDANRYEKTAKYTPRGAAIQTASHHPKTQEKPGIPRDSGPSLWQGQKDSNPRHAVLETAALPAELYPYLA